MNKIYRIIELETDNSHVELRKKSSWNRAATGPGVTQEVYIQLSYRMEMAFNEV